MQQPHPTFRPMRRLAQQLSQEQCDDILRRATSGTLALFEHDDERLHELMILRRDTVEAILSGMEVEKVEYHRLNGIDKHVAVEVMLWHGQPTVNLCKVVGTTLLLLWSKTHDGIVK